MKTRRLVAAAICMFAAATASHAATMNYGDFNAVTVDFIDVTEDNLESDLLYDVQGTVNDSLLIDPNSFGAQQNPGPGADFIDSELEMMIMAHPGGSVDMISFQEEGDYTLLGSGKVEASIAYFWQILEVDHAPIAPVSGNGTTSFSSTSPGSGQLWELDFDIDLNASLASAGQGGTITKVNFKFDNTLSAMADDASSAAFIKKKQFGGVQISVPEPAGFLSAIIGLLGLVRVRRS